MARKNSLSSIVRKNVKNILKSIRTIGPKIRGIRPKRDVEENRVLHQTTRSLSKLNFIFN